MTGRASSLYLWRGGALVVGPGIDSRAHSHYAAQLTVGLDRPFRTRLGAQDAWRETPAAIFAPNQVHQIDGEGAVLAHLFVELPQRLATDITVLDAAYQATPHFAGLHGALHAACGGALTIDGAQQLAQAWLQCALPDALASATLDRRVTQALDWIGAYPGNRLSGALLASKVNLSATRFTHLFRQKTGLSLSRYLLWSRLLLAVEAVAHGDNMTDAAHAAGFADLAHMSRTFRNTFGVVPSELQKMTIAFKRSGA